MWHTPRQLFHTTAPSDGCFPDNSTMADSPPNVAPHMAAFPTPSIPPPPCNPEFYANFAPTTMPTPFTPPPPCHPPCSINLAPTMAACPKKTWRLSWRPSRHLQSHRHQTIRHSTATLRPPLHAFCCASSMHRALCQLSSSCIVFYIALNVIF